MARSEPCRVTIAGHECSVLGGVWSAPIPAIRRALQAEEGRFRASGLRPPEPDADHASAVHAAERFGGVVVSRAKPDAVPGRVY